MSRNINFIDRCFDLMRREPLEELSSFELEECKEVKRKRLEIIGLTKNGLSWEEAERKVV